MKYGALCFNMKITGKRKGKLLSLGFKEEDIKNKRLIKFSKVFKPAERTKLIEMTTEELLSEIKGVSSETTRGLRKTMIEPLESDDYTKAN